MQQQIDGLAEQRQRCWRLLSEELGFTHASPRTVHDLQRQARELTVALNGHCFDIDSDAERPANGALFARKRGAGVQLGQRIGKYRDPLGEMLQHEKRAGRRSRSKQAAPSRWSTLPASHYRDILAADAKVHFNLGVDEYLRAGKLPRDHQAVISYRLASFHNSQAKPAALQAATGFERTRIHRLQLKAPAEPPVDYSARFVGWGGDRVKIEGQKREPLSSLESARDAPQSGELVPTGDQLDGRPGLGGSGRSPSSERTGLSTATAEQSQSQLDRMELRQRMHGETLDQILSILLAFQDGETTPDEWRRWLASKQDS